MARKSDSDSAVATLTKTIYSSRQACPVRKESTGCIGDAIFYGLLIFPVFGSALAWMASYLRRDNRAPRLRLLQRVLDLVHKAHRVRNLADDLGILFRRMIERATLEIEDLIDELHSLRTKLESDGHLIERAIERHSQFSQGTMQLTTMIADNVKRLPQPAS